MHSAVKIAKKFIDKSSSAPDMTPMKLLKLVYMAHGWTLGLYNKSLISEDVEAWKYGPVIPELYREIKGFGKTPVPSLPDSYTVQLDAEEQNIVDQVYEKYNKFTGVQLSSMTHAEGTPWHQVWNTVGCDVIPDEMIREYYRDLSGHGR